MASLEELHRTAPTSDTVEVTVRYAGAEKKIIGSPESIVRSLLAYFTEIIPSLGTVSKVVLTIDAREFLDSCAGVLASTQEGFVVLKDTSNLRDKELLMLQLAGARLTHLLSKRESDAISLEELTRLMERPTGTVAGRLSELSKEQLIERVGKGAYRLTTMGTRIVIRNVLPKLANGPEK